PRCPRPHATRWHHPGTGDRPRADTRTVARRPHTREGAAGALVWRPRTWWMRPTPAARTAPSSGRTRPQHDRAHRGQHPARAVGHRDLGAAQLALTTLPAQLADRLDDEEHAVLAGLCVREAAAVGVRR